MSVTGSHKLYRNKYKKSCDFYSFWLYCGINKLKSAITLCTTMFLSFLFYTLSPKKSREKKKDSEWWLRTSVYHFSPWKYYFLTHFRYKIGDFTLFFNKCTIFYITWNITYKSFLYKCLRNQEIFQSTKLFCCCYAYYTIHCFFYI